MVMSLYDDSQVNKRWKMDYYQKCASFRFHVINSFDDPNEDECSPTYHNFTFVKGSKVTEGQVLNHGQKMKKLRDLCQ